MFKKPKTAVGREQFFYVMWVVLFCLVVSAELSPVTIIMYGYFLSHRAYCFGSIKERDKSLKIYEPALVKARDELKKNYAEIREVNRQLYLLKQQIQKYENLS